MTKNVLIYILGGVLFVLLVFTYFGKPSKEISEDRRLDQCQLIYCQKLAKQNNVHAMELLRIHYASWGEYEKAKSFSSIIRQCYLKKDCNMTGIYKFPCRENAK